MERVYVRSLHSTNHRQSIDQCDQSGADRARVHARTCFSHVSIERSNQTHASACRPPSPNNIHNFWAWHKCAGALILKCNKYTLLTCNIHVLIRKLCRFTGAQQNGKRQGSCVCVCLCVVFVRLQSATPYQCAKWVNKPRITMSFRLKMLSLFNTKKLTCTCLYITNKTN